MPRRIPYGYLIPHVLRTVLHKPVTIAYPFGPLELPPSYRGRVTIDIERCVGCGLCARDCPCEALHVERHGKGTIRVVHYYDRCANCGQCEISCRHGALRIEPAFEEGAPTRDTMRIVWSKEANPSEGEPPYSGS